MSDLAQVFLLALVAMVNPTLLAAVTVMLLLPSPKRLMLGYLLGAYLTSIGVGLAIVFALHGSDAVETSKNTIAPGTEIVVGLLFLLIAFALATDRDRGLRERKARRKRAKQEQGGAEEQDSLPIRLLGRGSPRIAFAVGILLSFPGASYLTALTRIDRLDAAAAPTALLVVGFCLIQLLLIEVPLIGYARRPERTQRAVDDFRAWLSRNGRRVGIIGAAVIGAIVIIRGLAGIVG